MPGRRGQFSAKPLLALATEDMGAAGYQPVSWTVGSTAILAEGESLRKPARAQPATTLPGSVSGLGVCIYLSENAGVIALAKTASC